MFLDDCYITQNGPKKNFTFVRDDLYVLTKTFGKTYSMTLRGHSLLANDFIRVKRGIE